MLELLLTLILWAVVHSLTASVRFKSAVRGAIGDRAYQGTYRLGYNIVSALSLLPVFYLLATRLPDQILWAVPWPWRLANYAIQLAGVVGLLVALWQTDVWSFAGLRQFVRFLRGDTQPEPPGPFVSGGAYGLVRHPLYFFSLLVLWANPSVTLSSFALYVWVTLYFVAGSIHEERRLLASFGDDYRRYLQTVPGLLPWPRPGRGRKLTAGDTSDSV